MTATWTVVYRRSPFSPRFVPTDFHGSWAEASDYARSLDPAYAEVYVAQSDDRQVNGVAIAPTVAQKLAAQARANKVASLLTSHYGASSDSILRGSFGRIRTAAHPALPTDREMAEALVDAGWDWNTCTRAMS